MIPDFVEMSGTLRSLNAESREKMQAAIDRICISCAEAMRGSAEIRWEKGMPPLVNDRNVIEGLRTAAEKTIGADHVITVQNPSLGSEDFSFLFPLLAPGAQFRWGLETMWIPIHVMGCTTQKIFLTTAALRPGQPFSSSIQKTF